MPITYENRKKKKYYLHRGKTKTGKAKYYFSMKNQGDLVNKIPDGFEIYEHPANAQVFLRKRKPQIITDLEKYLVDKSLKTIKASYSYIVDIRGEIITIFESNQTMDSFREIFDRYPFFQNKNDSMIDEMFDQSAVYFPTMRFILQDQNMRTFSVERYCDRGSIDDWIYRGGPDSLDKLLNTFLPHLGQESFFELF